MSVKNNVSFNLDDVEMDSVSNDGAGSETYDAFKNDSTTRGGYSNIPKIQVSALGSKPSGHKEER